MSVLKKSHNGAVLGKLEKSHKGAACLFWEKCHNGAFAVSNQHHYDFSPEQT